MTLSNLSMIHTTGEMKVYQTAAGPPASKPRKRPALNHTVKSLDGYRAHPGLTGHLQ